MPGAGLTSEITAATVSAQGVVTITFTLTDAAGTALIPSTASTDDPRQARVQFTIAHLDVDTATTEGVTTTFTRYRNYIVPNPGQPGYDSGGSLGALDPARGIYTYTFATVLPPGFPATVTHTVGGQVQRTVGSQTVYANPLFDFVPAGGPVTTVRQVATTAECNGCHDPLAVHGGGRREVGLCQLCHTDQGFDPQSGNSIELQQMIHRIHRGSDLPSLQPPAPVGTKYEIIGFQNRASVFAEVVNACAGGALAGVPCSSDGDCPNGTCTGTTVTGVGFPQDIRSCTVCHSRGATAGDYLAKASTSACTGCHDDVNPSEMPTGAGPPGTNHVPGAQPEAFCGTICHVASGAEFGISVAGAHTVPQRSTQLTGLVGELLSASGSPGAPVSITFRLTDGAGAPLTTLTGLSTLALAISGPSTDFGGLTPPVTTPALIGGSASGTLTGPDGSGVFTYTTTVANGIPLGGTGTWRVGMEARRNVTVNGQTVQEAMQNVVRDFSVDGSAVVPRRAVVDQAKCASCHGVFSQGFSIHGSLRNRVEYCVLCHNPNMSDFARRVGVSGADPNTQPIDLKHMLHKIHTGENLTQQPYVIYGFNGSVNDFGDVLFPGNRADCEKCHLPDTFLLPLPPGLLPTRLTKIVSGVNTPVGSIPPIQDACLACHDDAATAVHAATNTAGGAEACPVCHGEGGIEPVSTVHANALL
jgi:predicted CXXCH cytochrome family protein